MKKIILGLFILIALSNAAYAALPATAVFQIQSTATSGNVNAGGFDPANANFLTDGAATSATGNAAVFTSASYNFAAGDVNAWLFISSGGTFNAGCYYKITSVAANAATVDSSLGHGVCVASNRYNATTVAGVASTASPTGATFGIDYSMLDAARKADTDLASTTGTTTPCTVTSVANPFGPQDAGNFLHITAGTNFTTGWYAITSVSGVTATLDKACGTSATLTAGTAKEGGALSLGSSDGNVFGSSGVTVTSATASTRLFIKGNATYTVSSAITEGPTANAAWPIIVEGYNSLRGDRPIDGTRPILNMGSNTFSAANSWFNRNLQFTGTASQLVSGGRFFDSKFTNTSTTASRVAWHGGNSTQCVNCEGISYRGNAFDAGSNNTFVVLNCYAHDSDQGISLGGGSGLTQIMGCIIANNVTGAIGVSTAITPPVASFIMNNTLYGAENKLGTGLTLPTGSNALILRNNIYYGFTTGISATDVSTANLENYSDFFNNTTDVNDATKLQKGPNDLALDPTFAGVAQRTGSTATTTAGNHLVQSGATFQSWGVTPGRDFLYISGGTGASIVGKYGILSVDSETQITTDIALTADATADKTWSITTGRNFAIGTNLKAGGNPAAFPGGYTTGYTDIGAVQRQENTSPTVHSSTFVQ